LTTLTGGERLSTISLAVLTQIVTECRDGQPLCDGIVTVVQCIARVTRAQVSLAKDDIVHIGCIWDPIVGKGRSQEVSDGIIRKSDGSFL